MGTAALYCRISLDRTGAGLGVERQEQDCRQLAARLGLTVGPVHCDNDMSAYSRKPRPGWAALCGDVEAGRVHAVIAWHTDRLYRRGEDLERLIVLCDRRKVPVHTVTAGDLDLATATGRAVARTVAVWSQHESEHKGERQARAARQAAELGRPHGGLRPYGFQPDRLTVCEPEAAVVRETAERILAGEGVRSVAADLNLRRVRTVTGRPWSATVLRSMLLRPRLAGWRSHLGVKVTRGGWPPILSDVQHDALTVLLTDPGRRTVRPAGRVHLLAGLLTCGRCGARLTTVLGGPDRSAGSRRMYGCERCRRIYRSAVPLEAQVVEYVVGRLERGGLSRPAPDRPAVSADLAAVRARIVMADDAFADDMTVSVESHRRITARLRAREVELLSRVGDAHHSRVVAAVDRRGIRAGWAGLPLSRRRALVEAVCGEVRVLPAPGRRVYDPTRVIIAGR